MWLFLVDGMYRRLKIEVTAYFLFSHVERLSSRSKSLCWPSLRCIAYSYTTVIIRRILSNPFLPAIAR